MFSRFPVLIFLAVILTFHLYAAELVKDGKPNGVILLPEHAVKSAKLGAYELQYHIRLLTGAELPIRIGKAETGDGPVRIFVGAHANTPKNSDFGEQEYRITVRGNDIFLQGNDMQDHTEFDYKNVKTFPSIWENIATCYAVYEFLEQCGIRWYLPAEPGIIFTPVRNLQVPDMNLRDAPKMKQREPYRSQYSAELISDTVDRPGGKLLDTRETELWKFRSRFGGSAVTFGHSFYKYYERFPDRKEIWAKGQKGKPSQLCYSNPETVKLVVQDLRDYFDGKLPEKYAASFGREKDSARLGYMDNTSWCNCEACQKLLGGKPDRNGMDAASNYWFSFVNNVAREIKKSHPDKFICTSAYWATRYPPDKFRLEDNVLLKIVFHVRAVNYQGLYESNNDILQTWRREYPKMQLYTHLFYCYPMLHAVNQQTRFFPPFFARHVKEYMKQLNNADVKGTFVEMTPGAKGWGANLLFDQLESYLHWKLAFHPDLNADAIIDEFFRKYYGPAEKPMKLFYFLTEERYCDAKLWPPYTLYLNRKISWESLGTTAVMKQLENYMEEAKKLAVSEPFKTRVELFEKGVWVYMRKGKKQYDALLYSQAPSMMQAIVPHVRVKNPGAPASVDWEKAGRLRLYGGKQGELLKDNVDVRLAHDGTWLYLRYFHGKIDPAKLDVNAGGLWSNDLWETFFARQRAVPYRQFAFDAGTNEEGLENAGIAIVKWSFPGKIVQQKNRDNWTTLLAIKLRDVVEGGLKPGDIFYYNVFRYNCSKGKARQFACWMPTFGISRTPDRFGELYLEKDSD